MAQPNAFNVYKGPDSMKNYFDPDFQPPIPLVELPSKLNPFRSDNVRIYAKMLTLLPAQNVKALPALNMLLNNPSAANKSIIEASSGSTATSLGMIARVLYNNDDTRVFVTNKTELNRIRQLQFFGLKVEVYGGPAQPEITDKRGIITKAINLAKDNENIRNPGQYESEFNWKSHIRWTGPQLWKQLPEINIFCMGMGSAGCVTGTGIYLKSHKPSVKVLGVCNAVGDPVPGPRAFPLFESCKFPWRETVDFVESVTSVDSYRLSMLLSREGLVCGPSSGMGLKGLFQFLQRAKDDGKLSEFADSETGEISCVFVCCDLPQQYLDGYFTRLGEEDFHPIINKNLLSFDLDTYVLDWELTPENSLKMLYGEDWSKHGNPICVDSSCCKDRPASTYLSSDATLIDLRSPQEFDKMHISHSKNLPLPELSVADSYLFDDIPRLHSQWKNMKTMFGGETLPDLLNPISKPKIVVCFDGETSRLATAVMRARGVEAFSIRGGIPAVVQSVRVES